MASASKIVFIMMAIGVHAALFMGKITGDQYIVLASMSFTYYFSYKGSPSSSETTTTETAVTAPK